MGADLPRGGAWPKRKAKKLKLATYTFDGSSGIGAVTTQGIVPLSSLASTMIELIENWDQLKGKAEELASSMTDAVPMEQVTLAAPIPRPGKVLAIGLNYKDHIAESGLATPEHQLWFGKQPTSINPPYAAIDIPLAGATTVDYEAELVAVIGRPGRHIGKANAASHIFGYCCGNDVSVREWQRQTAQWMLGKSFDTHAPIGPWIVTPDEITDPHSLDISCSVNGEVRQSSNTCHLLFDVFDQVAHLSKVMTLEPGDVIFTGTSGGVGAARKPPAFLQPGDRVRVEIDQLGAIEGEMVAERA